jgi:hypothetical protein
MHAYSLIVLIAAQFFDTEPVDVPSVPQPVTKVVAADDSLTNLVAAFEQQAESNQPIVVDLYSGTGRCIHCDRMTDAAADYEAAGISLNVIKANPPWRCTAFPHLVWRTQAGQALQASGYRSPEELSVIISKNEPGRMANKNAMQSLRLGTLKGTREAAKQHIEAVTQWLGRDGQVELKIIRGADANGSISVPGTSVALDLPREVNVRYEVAGEGLRLTFLKPLPAVKVGKLLPLRQEIRGASLTTSEITIDLPWMIDPTIGLE